MMALWDIAARTLTQLSSSVVGLVIKRFSSGATGNLLEFYKEDGTTLNTFVGSDGHFQTTYIDSYANFQPVEWRIQSSDSGGEFRLYNVGAGNWHFRSFFQQFGVPTVTPGYLNPYNSLTALRLGGLATTSGKPTSSTWAAGDTFLDSKGVGQLCTTGGAPGTWVSGGWQLAGFWKAGSALQTSGAITVAAFDELMIVCRVVSMSATDIPALRFNGDTAANYWSRYLTSVAGGVTLVNTANASDTMAKIAPLTGTAQRHAVCYVSNKLAATKLATVHSQGATAAAATTGTLDVAGAFEWINTSAQITSVTMLTSGGTNTMAIDSGFQVFGRDLA